MLIAIVMHPLDGILLQKNKKFPLSPCQRNLLRHYKDSIKTVFLCVPVTKLSIDKRRKGFVLVRRFTVFFMSFCFLCRAQKALLSLA